MNRERRMEKLTEDKEDGRGRRTDGARHHANAQGEDDCTSPSYRNCAHAWEAARRQAACAALGELADEGCCATRDLGVVRRLVTTPPCQGITGQSSCAKGEGDAVQGKVWPRQGREVEVRAKETAQRRQGKARPDCVEDWGRERSIGWFRSF